jgi:hypothetical protein
MSTELVWGEAEPDRMVSNITPEGIVYAGWYDHNGSFVASRRDTLGPKSKVLGLRYRTRQHAVNAAARDYAKLAKASQIRTEP